ncbi:FMN reductase (NADPH) [Caldalkalibacillus thermarum]|uniref:oxygen-insensitive NADPH nitroreductase n=1 Tax=Caldalkalibacillus thermarum TaxID=296745 RepID=UPI001665625D|nr:oxygen-insensitive NADPH nitroreductase [Caldalkalibacillus thermarum]GGK20348.1 FMN reductase (NADPH) [Caldalkalibacillus thermarum]
MTTFPAQAERVVQLLQGHRSIRKFTEEKIPAATISEIIRCAQMASTSSHLQAYSIIGVTEQSLKQKLAEYAGNQTYVETCSHFLVFCADLHRLDYVTRAQGVDVTETLETTEKFIVATVDAALAAQNAAVAAEAHGLGIVYIGGIRNNPDKVADLLGLPDKVYPVFGMCLGYPDQDPEVKPRLPQSCVYFENRYPDLHSLADELKQYDQEVKQYYLQRTKGKRQDTWTDMVVKTLSTPSRTHMKSFLKEQGFPLK